MTTDFPCLRMDFDIEINIDIKSIYKKFINVGKTVFVDISSHSVEELKVVIQKFEELKSLICTPESTQSQLSVSTDCYVYLCAKDDNSNRWYI
jgi:hypothetical protein